MEPKHYNRYTIRCDGPTGKVPGIQKRISATLTVLTFPNLTRSTKLLPVSGNYSIRLKLWYREHGGKNAAHEVAFCNLSRLSCGGTAWGVGPLVLKSNTSPRSNRKRTISWNLQTLWKAQQCKRGGQLTIHGISCKWDVTFSSRGVYQYNSSVDGNPPKKCMRSLNRLILNGYCSSMYLGSGKLSGTNPADHTDSNSSIAAEYTETQQLSQETRIPGTS